LTPISVTGAAENAWGPVQGYVARRSATATKTDTPIIETPQSISVITADRYNTLGATNIKDALAYTPGVSTTTYGSDSRYDWVSLRGFD
ncbi:TonB-dependent receptor plug domain-containing protein, partial [Paraburkholderia sp. SIMBA_050]